MTSSFVRSIYVSVTWPPFSSTRTQLRVLLHFILLSNLNSFLHCQHMFVQ